MSPASLNMRDEMVYGSNISVYSVTIWENGEIFQEVDDFEAWSS